MSFLISFLIDTFKPGDDDIFEEIDDPIVFKDFDKVTYNLDGASEGVNKGSF